MNTHLTKHELNTTGAFYKRPTQQTAEQTKHWGDLLLNVPTPVGVKAQAVRRLRGKTQQQVADVLGIDAASMSGFERGTMYLSLPHFAKLCVYLDVSADSLLSL